MMLREYWFLVLHTVLLSSITVICDITSDKYSYLLFENFEMTKESFKKEQKVFTALRVNRNNLHYKLDELNLWTSKKLPSIVGRNLQKTHEQPLENCLHISINYMISTYYFRKKLLLNDFQPGHHKVGDKYNFVFDFEKMYRRNMIDIMKGGLRGLVMLQETYEQDIQLFSKGHLRLKNHIDTSSRFIDSLRPDDLAAMSVLAFDFYKWYDNSLKYLKEALRSFYLSSYAEKNNGGAKDGLEEYLLAMKIHYSSYHNHLHSKKKNILGNGWKLYPYMVDEGRATNLCVYQISLIGLK